MSDQNAGIIEEFRANGGKVGGFFETATLLLLHTTGARTGRAHMNPCDYLPDGDRFVVFATYGGMPKNPDWYYNLIANSDAVVETGTGMVPVRAVEIVDETEREELYARQVERRPNFAEYPHKTSRRIPIIALAPREEAAGISPSRS